MNIKKKSQISIFVIAVVVILGLILLLFLFQFKVIKIDNKPAPDEINDFVKNCIEKSANNGVYFIADSGGYYILPNLSTQNTAYYFYNNINYMPKKEQIENEIEEYTNDAIFLCTKNFVDFPSYEVKAQAIKTNVTILNDRVLFEVKYPLSITKSQTTYKVENFETEVKVRLGVIYDSIKEILDMQMENKDICLDCINDIAIKNNLYISMRDYDNDVMFGVFDLDNQVNEEDFAFYYVNQYEK